MNRLYSILVIIVSWVITVVLVYSLYKMYCYYDSHINDLEAKVEKSEKEFLEYKNYRAALELINVKKQKVKKKYNNKSGIALTNDINSVLLSFGKYQEGSSESSDPETY